jgi:predicted GH43/DUF377 family glycosyl hydrolase
MTIQSLTPQPLRRLGVIMEPILTDPREVEGVLNPAVTRGPDGALYLLPRLVGPGNYSRIGLARVCFTQGGDPVGVERLGVVLEPQEPYELNRQSGGGVEDARVTYLALWRLYVMTYTAFGPAGPRVAAAISRDLVHWRRTGLVRFAYEQGLDLARCDNKDGLLFPEPVAAPDGRPALALLHRPTFPASPPTPGPPVRPAPRPSIWISYAPLEEPGASRSVVFGQHHLLAGPEQRWEHLKIGGGTPPVRTRAGWLLLYHGVAVHRGPGAGPSHAFTYRAGVMLLDSRDPRRVVYRTVRSILAPRVAAERVGVVPRVVFPTGLDVRADGTVDVYYGMADRCIGVARTTLPDLLRPAAMLAA